MIDWCEYSLLCVRNPGQWLLVSFHVVVKREIPGTPTGITFIVYLLFI